MAIALRGALNDITGSRNNGNDVVLTFDTITPPLVDDIVVVFGGTGIGSVTTLGVPSGNTSGNYIQIGIHTGSAPLFGMWYQRMGATPDLTVTCAGSGDNADGVAYGCYVLSGVDTTTAQDATATTAGPTSSTNPDAPSITTANTDSWVIPCAGGDIRDLTPGTIADYSNQLEQDGNDTNDITIAAATFENPEADAENPAAWSSWATSNWYAITAAFRAAPVAGDHDITVPIGSLTITGQTPVAITGFVLAPPSTTAVLTGEVPPLIQTLNHIRAPPIGSITGTGQVPTVERSWTISPAIASLSLSGGTPFRQSLVFINTSASKSGATLLPSYYNQSATSVKFDDPVGAPTGTVFIGVELADGSICWSGAVTVSAAGGDKTIEVAIGSLVATGAVPVLSMTVVVPIGGLTAAGQTATVERSWTIIPGIGSLTFGGAAADTNHAIQVAAGSLSLSGSVATAERSWTIVPGIGSAVLTGGLPVAQVTQLLPVGAGSGVFSGSVPTIERSWTVTPAAGSISTTGSVPDAGQSWTITPPVGTASFVGQFPALEITLASPNGTLVAQGHIPLLIQTFSIGVPAGTLVLTGSAPATGPTRNPGAGSLTLSGSVPQLVTAFNIVVPAGSATFSGSIPSLQITQAIPVAAG